MNCIISITTMVLFFITISFAAEHTYFVPDEFKPMSTWRNGWSAEETWKYRLEYNDNTMTGGEYDGAYAITHLSAVLPTAIVHRNGSVAVLESAPMPEIAGNLGDRMIAHFGDLGMGTSYQWDAVFPDGDPYKSGRGGQCLYISPESDTVVVYVSASYQSSLWVHA